MKYYYDFDMEKTFTEEELKKAYEEIKEEISYCNFDDFIQCEKMYMDEISEELFESIRKQEQKVEMLLQRLNSLETEVNERLNEIPEQFNDLEDSENYHYYLGTMETIRNIKDILGE